ncbi:sporulation protein YunB [Anaerobacillus sp. MEB173]|uniref:sporulation protein YunB n=1 Tax=Anaerobacillus sp. MEB173 TaxID=3383345 RepID=UPI003F8F0167
MRFRKKPRKVLPFRYVLIISFLIFTALTVQGLWIVEKGIRPTLLEIANLETQKIATSAINYAVSNAVKNVNMNELIVIEKDEEGKVSTIGFDATIYNSVVTTAVTNAQYYLKMMEEGKLHELEILGLSHISNDSDIPGVIYTIPLGQSTNNALLAQLGPLVPVKFTTIGDVGVQLNEEVKHVGINNSWVRVSMDIEVQSQVIIPFATNTDKVSTTVPVGMIYIQGEVPEFYSGMREGGFPHPLFVR